MCLKKRYIIIYPYLLRYHPAVRIFTKIISRVERVNWKPKHAQDNRNAVSIIAVHYFSNASNSIFFIDFIHLESLRLSVQLVGN